MKIYQIQYTNWPLYIKRELKDVDEKISNLSFPFYLTISTSKNRKVVLVKLIDSLTNETIKEWYTINNIFLKDNILEKIERYLNRYIRQNAE